MTLKCPKCGAVDKMVRVHFKPFEKDVAVASDGTPRVTHVGRSVMRGGEGGELRLRCEDCGAILPDDVQEFEFPKRKEAKK